jgi:hypothetical protein
LWAKVQEVDKRARPKVLIACDSRWAGEDLRDWAAIEYPDMDTYQQKTEGLEKLNWWRYWSGKTILGTKIPETL